MSEDPWLEETSELVEDATIRLSPRLTRRLSESSSLAREPQQEGYVHTRAHTTDGHVGYDHPLQTPTVSAPNRDSATRPQLARMLSDFEPKESEDQTSKDSDSHATIYTEEDSPSKKKRVVIHEVKSADTLAGVALKYGVSMAALRRVNHMWASDSIHLRRQLYIPLDTATDKDSRSEAGGSPPLRITTQELSSLNLRELPESELSFFNPRDALPRQASPSDGDSRLTSPPNNTKFNAVAIPRRTKIHGSPVSSGSSLSSEHQMARLPSHGLSSLFTATRAPLDRITRVSMESSRSSLDKSSGAGDEHEQGHELDLLNGSNQEISSCSTRGYRSAETLALRSSDSKSFRSPEHLAMYGSTVDTEVELSAERTAFPIRTAQMEPSPAMQLPIPHQKRRGNSHISSASLEPVPGKRS
ncbi:hypothetical protein GLOTRDRAFT_137501 [Gloeophyllum trabeum ATCC 11539]|uniref:LysM domain-containing protein n=1 Tax=Gloeophyllum trabeum (strain ATCC 11539 / FP-39264 / Madison 617) TaxID=670483 RepID=S7QCH1_GLOTA|nr:uncharacterized protein GLOTRDRAFT_137501 [Gloeophyllum trabeum ATCC 11539]EPQ57078.1 hypothetical protein GLOTRDRAFT_137501 [Gloeophyllum trabeum ATCC 11539]